jgi:hypothetical protein
MTSHPPRVATWILRTLGSGAEIEPLLGDLSEAYLAGRSRTWFWWQVLIAIPITVVDTVRSHPFLMVRALACGWLGLLSLRYVARKIIAFIEVVGYLEWSTMRVPAYRVVDGVRVPAGTIPMDSWHYLYSPALSFVAIFASAAITSWVVGRLHARVRTTAVLTFTAMLTLLWMSRYLPAPAPTFPEDLRILDGWWFSFTWLRWSPLLLQVSGSLLGGLLFTQRAPRRRERGGDGWSPA